MASTSTPARRTTVVLTALTLAALAACGGSGPDDAGDSSDAAVVAPLADDAAPAPEDGSGSGGSDSAAGSGGEPVAEPVPEPVDPAEVQANELGQVPVLMYHQLIEDPKGIYDRTRADFRAELERLAEEGYVPVTAVDYASGNIDIPAGAHPVVLTFDDATTNQLTLGPDGEPLPDTAIGILLDVAKEHPGFTPVATMYVNIDPFAEAGGKGVLTWLHENGFEIGNHTLTHGMLRDLDAAGVQEELAANVEAIQAAVPDAEVRTMALPLGVSANDMSLVLAGESGGTSYENIGVMLVGSNPAPSPFAASFDPAGIPRMRSQGTEGPDAEWGSTKWLDDLAEDPSRRYTSDGNPGTISFPAERADLLAPAHAELANPY